jgi:integrase/recombinase XerD
MKVQRVRLPDTNRVTWLVLDDLYTPIQPILTYLKHIVEMMRIE